jgi:cell division protein ZapD
MGMAEAECRTVLYEYPFNERVRTLLRLEDLFEKLAFFQSQTHHLCHHTALLTLFEILDVTARADLKSDLLQELERHKHSLSALRNNPQVSEAALASVLAELDRAQQALNGTTGKAGQHLRDNEWLTSIRSRAAIPGGTCEFDLPSYHAWLMRDGAIRARDLEGWTRPLAVFIDALGILLRLLRESAHRSTQLAVQGAYQQTLQGRTYSLLQVRVAADENAIPEISANKYMLWIRFTAADRDLKPKSVERDVPFHLALCSF